MHRHNELTILRWLVRQLETIVRQMTERETLTMTLVTNNDSAVRLRPSGVDRDGVAVAAADLTDLTFTVDHPEVASLAPDPANPGTYLLTPLPATDPTVGARTVIVTATDPAKGRSVQTSVEFDPGAETSLAVATEIVPLAVPSGGTVAKGTASGEAS